VSTGGVLENEKNLIGQQLGSLAEVAKQFLRLGFIAYGGPAAHVAMMEEEFVRRRGWLTRERFLDLVGAVNLLPGPSSTELAIYLGEVRAGLPGLIVAGACFILPAAFLVGALAWAYMRFGPVPQVAGLLFGIKPVVVALIAQAVWNLGQTALRDVPLAALALVVILRASRGMDWPREWMRRRSTERVAGFFLLFENWGGAIWQRLCAFARLARRLGGETPLAQRFAIVGCRCRQPGDAGPIFHRSYVHRIPAGRLEGRNARHAGDVYAGVRLRCYHVWIFA